ncbi:MAG: hypothetical protein ABMA64_34915 [Myxococcota bacterium]
MASHPHLTLSLSRELWNELLSAALPVRLAGDRFDVVRNTRQLLRQLGVRDRVAGLLPDRRPPALLVRARDRARKMWVARKPGLYRRLNDLVRVEGEWRVELDQLGTELRYSRQKVGADAFVKGVAEGTLHLLNENVELPFRIERRLGASVALGDVHYDPAHRAVIGTLQDLEVHLGESATMAVVARLAEYLLEQQLPRVNPIPILRRDQVEEMVGPMGGPLRMQLGVEDLDLVIDEHDLTLKVRFGFSRALAVPERALADTGAD